MDVYIDDGHQMVSVVLFLGMEVRSVFLQGKDKGSLSSPKSILAFHSKNNNSIEFLPL
jgi:hypothetical protein